MKLIHLDAVGGIAGDMFVAAMLDALPALKDRVLADAAAVLPPEAGKVVLAEGESGAVRALRFGLDRKNQPALRHAHAEAGHHVPDRHRHEDEHHIHPHVAGRFRDLVARIETGGLSKGTARHAVGILTILAEAEAKIHRVQLDDVHFHEIADWDSLLDVVAAGSIAAALTGAMWTVSPLPRGGGLVHSQHGLLPVPAPATAAILTGFEWRDDGIPGERVTPTGAAILKHLVRAVPGGQSGRLAATGTGAGTRKLPGMPNVLRALVFESMDGSTSDRVAVLEFEVDDMTGEEIGVSAGRLRDVAGVLDLSMSQRLGKKGRPMQSFRLLVRPEAVDAVAASCFTETSTIGLRVREERRIVLPRTAATVAGVPVKSVARPSGSTTKAESDGLSGDSLDERRALKRLAEGSDG